MPWCRDGGIHKCIDTGIVEENDKGWGGVGWHVRKTVDSKSSSSSAWLYSALMFVHSTEEMLLLGSSQDTK